jgi:hypothetical protein
MHSWRYAVVAMALLGGLSACGVSRIPVASGDSGLARSVSTARIVPRPFPSHIVPLPSCHRKGCLTAVCEHYLAAAG